MRELDNGVADAMRTSSQTEVEECELVYSDKSVFADEYTDEAFCDEFGEMVAEAEPSDQVSESDDMDGYMEDPDSLWGRIERQMGAKEYQVWLAEHLTQRKVKQINIHIDLDLYKLLVPAAAIAGVAILALGYRKQDKLIGGLKAIKNQLKSIKKD